MKLIIAASVFFLSTTLFAAEWDAAQSDVWKVVSNSWVDDVGETGAWPFNYVHGSVVQWDAQWPAPRDANSIARWTRFRDSNSEVKQYELFPQAIVVEGNTAVVHYSVVMVRQNAMGRNVRSVSGTIETLVRTNGDWKYLSLTGFEISSDDD